MTEKFIPTREFVEALQVGHKALDCFGRWHTVVEIFGRGDDINGRAYVCYYTELGDDGGKISGSLKEAELARTVPLCNDHNSWQLDQIEAQLNAKPGAIVVNALGYISTFWPAGAGAYPYDCRSKDKHPDAMIYANDTAWVGEYELKFIPERGYYAANVK